MNFEKIIAFTLMVFSISFYAQAPGGVSTGLSYWYRADKNATNTGAGTDVTGWTDMRNGTTVVQMGTNVLPKYAIGTSTYFNFNPGINFTATTQTLGNISVQTLTSLNYDIFTLTKEGIVGTRFFNIGRDNTTFNGTNWDSPAYYPDGRIVRRDNAGNIVYWTNPGNNVVSAIPSILYTTYTDVNLRRAVNGSSLSTAGANHSPVGAVTGGHIFGRNFGSLTGGDDDGFTGHIGEAIVYGAGTLSSTERRRVDSYLAIKYGITLGQVATGHYLDTAGAVVWNGATNTTFNSNIFGVSRDDAEAFEQKVSKSVNTGAILTVATTNNFVNPNLDVARTGFANDKTYFLLGDNNVTATALNAITVNGSTGQRIQRTWLSQRQNTPGTLFFEADLSSYGASFGLGNNVRMIIADDPAFTTNVVSVAGTFTGGRWVHNYNFNADAANRYITYAVILVDSDNDGIADATDLDDDNDGILDSNECYGEKITNGTFTSDSNAGWVRGTGWAASGNRMYNTTDNLLNSILSQTVTSPLSTQTYKLTFNLGARDVASANRTAQLIIKLGGVTYATFDNLNTATNNLTVTMANGATSDFVGSQTVGNATEFFKDVTILIPFVKTGSTTDDIEFVMNSSSPSGDDWSLDNISMIYGCDTDNDGTPDYLDLDSDNDNCVDAIEGDENVTSAMLVTSAGTVTVGTGSTASNQNLCATSGCVDVQGVPTVVNSGGAADIGNDQGQGAGNSQNGLISDCKDSDGDGIFDSIDLDDDNDGILDSNEIQCLTVNAIQPTPAGAVNSYPSTGMSPFTATFGISTVQSAAYIYTTSLFGYTNVTGVAAQTNTGSPVNSITFNRPVYSLDAALDDVDGSETATLRFYDVNNNLIPGSVVQQYVVFTGSSINSVTYPAGQSINVIGNSGASSGTSGAVRMTFPSSLGISRIEYAQVTTGGGGSNNGLLLMNGCVDVDTDGDGIANRLDLDSDGDTCTDAIEGGAAFTTANLVTATGAIAAQTPNQNLGNSVGNTPTTLGVPTIAGAGQSVAQSQDNSKNDCLDSDADTYPDWQDLDDDNDGILDTVECTTINNSPLYHLFDADQVANNNSLMSLYKQTNGVGSTYVCPATTCAVTVPVPFFTTNLTDDITNLAYDDGKFYTIRGGNLLFSDDLLSSPFVSLGNANVGVGVANLAYEDGVFYHWFNNAGVPTLYQSTNPVTNNWTLVGAMPGLALSFVESGLTYTLQDMAKAGNTYYFLYYSTGGSSFSNYTRVLSSTSPTSSTPSWTNNGSANFGFRVFNMAYGSEDLLTACDTDEDGIPNHLDLDSDNDGCSDAIEGAENVIESQLNPNGSINITLAAPNNGVGTTAGTNLGVPNLVNSGGTADTGSTTAGSVGQPIGSSQNASVSACVCYQDPTLVAGQTYPVKHGITVLGRAGADNGNWPMLRNSAYTALESKTKGLVITRNSSPETTITSPVVGMTVFDTDENSGAGCLKIYTGSGTGEGWKCFSTQGCP